MFQRVNRTDAEKMFIIVQNVSAATITAGYPAVWDITTSVDGVRVSKPATATLSLFVGIANADIADSSYGLVQVYGYRASAYITNDTSNAVAAGDLLAATNAQWYLSRIGAGNAAVSTGAGMIYAAEAFATATTPAAANKKVLIRAL